LADVVAVIGGGHVDVHGLMGPGEDPHLTPLDKETVRSLMNRG